ncbi:MAG: heparinase II/III family protein [Phycisphaerales bacterium]|nr:MAG: heparinase II/III family protein [Phycisphaerales bacterium]
MLNRPNQHNPHDAAGPPRCTALRLIVLLAAGLCPAASACAARHPVPQEHPRLLGSRQELKDLAQARPETYQRVVHVVREAEADDHAKMISLALVCAIEDDAAVGEAAIARAMRYIDGPIRHGHVPFGSDLARCALVYDLCHAFWTDAQRAAFHEYVNKTVEANLQSETHVFHNGWYGYKNWGIGLAGYATYYENPQAPEILSRLEEDFRNRAAPALELAGDGGGWAEGYYIHYWLYEWLFFCEAARRCEGLDYYALAPDFFNQRAIAGMFEMYPGISRYGSRRPIPMGDGGGRLFGGDRDKALAARRILTNYFRNDAEHQAVHAFNETTPRVSVGIYAYKDFLWRDTTIQPGSLDDFRLSHVSPGPGYVYARSSWDEDATYFFFKCGDRFTAHQHLDVGHFVIYKHGELAGDGGHYDAFGSAHDVNYHLRTIAHSTILVYDPAEQWLGATAYEAGIRAGDVTGNDGGQTHSWPNHNGAVADVEAWQAHQDLYDVADIVAFEDRGDYLYVAGDCTRAYARQKLTYFTRQILFLRPSTFVIFDRVRTTRPEFKKTWLLQAMKPPTGTENHLVVSNGEGRLFLQTLLPPDPQVRLAAGADLYNYGDHAYPPSRDTGAAPECRIEISAPVPRETDYFLHVLTATDSATKSVPTASATVDDESVYVHLGPITIAFLVEHIGGFVTTGVGRTPLAQTIVSPRGAAPIEP